MTLVSNYIRSMGLILLFRKYSRLCQYELAYHLSQDLAPLVLGALLLHIVAHREAAENYTNLAHFLARCLAPYRRFEPGQGLDKLNSR